MKIVSGVVYIDGIDSISGPDFTNMSFTDLDNTKINIDIKTLLRLHDILRFDIETIRQMDWEEYISNFFKDGK
jgi:hypothetical protein